MGGGGFHGYLYMQWDFKGTSNIPESYLPSLATSCEYMASNSEQIMEKTRKFQIVYAASTKFCKQTN